ncbi:uncharacterized protein [Panulirus ornatus]|uniref:uncharacterized protein n=1 Tax=Panulirus ornatus TaxID=150431 RepID=UPI003A889443
MEVIKEDVHGELGDTRGVADHEGGREEPAGAAGLTRHASVMRPDLWPPRVPRVVGLLLKNGSWMPADTSRTTPGRTTTGGDVHDRLLARARQSQTGEVGNHPGLTGEEEVSQVAMGTTVARCRSHGGHVGHGGHVAHGGLQEPEMTYHKFLAEVNDAESHCSEHIDTLRGNLWCKCDAANAMLQYSSQVTDEQETRLGPSNHEL